MKNASPALLSLLAGSSQFVMADLFTITLASGVTVRYTSADADLTVGAYQFTAQRIKRGRVRMVCGVEVDTLDINFFTTSGESPGGIPFIQSINAGVLDGAHVLLERVFMPTFGDTSAGTVVLFAGRVADVSFGRSETRLHVKSDLELLNINMPRNLYQPGCIHTLFDAGCALSKSAFVHADVVQSGATVTTLRGGVAQADHHFALGTITFDSGANAGASHTIKSYVGGLYTLVRPLVHAPQAGDSFRAYPGCDKTQATCESRFANVIHFRGYPYVPVPETAA